MAKIDFINSLPKKHGGTAAIFFNNKGELLVVKPNYREGWLVPGGSFDELESPMDCCTREIKEEIGLDIVDIKCVGVHYGRKKSEEGITFDSIQFTFYAGVLSDEQIKNIVLQEKELTEYKFVSLEEAYKILIGHLAQRIKTSLDALEKNTFIYTETKE